MADKYKESRRELYKLIAARRAKDYEEKGVEFRSAALFSETDINRDPSEDEPDKTSDDEDALDKPPTLSNDS
ncbi:MAG: hypothetical protein AAFV45_12735 [Pseudomonadota bacterium]